MKLKLLACQSLWREVYYLASKSSQYIDIQLIPAKTITEGNLQQIIDDTSRTQEDYDAILLACGFCGGKIEGLTNTLCPIIIPRAHDCITLILGSKERYRDVFEHHDGELRFYSRGTLEVGGCQIISGVKGDDDCCVVSPIPGLCHPNPNAETELAGDLSLLEKLMAGNWADEDFLTLSPGQRLSASYDHAIISTL